MANHKILPLVKSRLYAMLGIPRGAYYLFYRHKWPVRVMHWLNAIFIAIMFMSGLAIFNAHPALYWGRQSDFAHPAFSLMASEDADGTLIGITRIGSRQFDTTGVLGASMENGQMTARGFPSWITLPGPQWLAMGRQWHFAFAWLLVVNGILFIVYALASRHFQRDLMPTKNEITHLPCEIIQHAKLHFPKGEAARRYNGLQKLAYVFVIFILGPLVVATGLTMSPTMDAAFPQLLWLFGGRQSARTIHFICAFFFLGFFLVHIAMVILSGSWNNIRSMVTGRYAIQKRETENG